MSFDLRTLTSAQVFARLTTAEAKGAFQRLSKLTKIWNMAEGPDVSPWNPKGKKYYLNLSNVYTRPKEETEKLFSISKHGSFCDSFDEGVVNKFKTLTRFLQKSGDVVVVSTKAELKKGLGKQFQYSASTGRFFGPGEKNPEMNMGITEPLPAFVKKITLRKRKPDGQ